MNRISLVFMIAAVLALKASAQQQHPLHLSGFVTDSETSKPIAGVSVSAVRATHPAVTAADGTFSLELLETVKPGDEVRIRVEKSGYRVDDLPEVASEYKVNLILLVPLKSGHGMRQPKPTNQPPGPTQAAGPSVREAGLTLYRDISSFLEERQQNEPFPRLHGTFSLLANCDASFDDHDSETPIYMKETRKMFADKFQTRISEVHDELAARGLQDSPLESMYRCVGKFEGNVDHLIKETAESIQKLASLVPPTTLYADVSDSKLATIALDQITLIDQKILETRQQLMSNPISPGGVEFHSSYDLTECCLDQLEYLRAEILSRLGPSAFDAEEIHSFVRLTERRGNPSSAFWLTSEYAPYFRRLATKMKRKALPPPSPQTLRFSETDLGPGLDSPASPRQVSHRLVITVQAPHELDSGYIVVLFDSRAAMISSDLADAKLIIDDRDVVENPPLAKLLARNPTANAVYALRIGRTALSPTLPLRVFASSDSDIHVTQALFFEY